MKWYLKCLKQYTDFSGRARRKEYWMFLLFNCIFCFVLAVIDAVISIAFDLTAGVGILTSIYTLCVFIPSLAVCVRRLHDIGKSGWFYFLFLIPIVGAIILIVWYCKEGERCSNAWGEDPKKNEQ